MIDSEDNTLFHVASSASRRYAARPEDAQDMLEALLSNGWAVVDQKNLNGERAEIVADRLDPHGPWRQMLRGRSHDFREPLRSEKPVSLIGELTPTPWKWQYLVQDEQRRSWAGVSLKAFPPEKCKEWMAATLKDSPWADLPGVPRKVAWFVSQECVDCPYRYSGLEYPPTVYPPFMQEIRAEVCKLCGIPENEFPNSCNVNVYDDHEQDVGWHSDDEVMFQGLSGDTRIISFSLGSARDFSWRLQGTTEILGSVPLGDGDVMTMEGLFQKHYKHSVPKSTTACGKRVNYTFRWIKVKAHAADAGTKGVNV
jgi:alkylated DNA repair dioxygenase AlkB